MRTLSALAGSIILLLAFIAPSSAQEIVPTVRIVETVTHPPVPRGWKQACVLSATIGAPSKRCPVLEYNGYTYWAWSDINNAVAMAIVAYDSHGNAVKQWNRNGARYIWNITVDAAAQTVSFIGQSNAAIRFSWSDLFIPQVPNALTFVNADAHAVACIFSTTCSVTVSDTTGNIPFPPVVTGTGFLQSRTFTGGAGSPGAGKNVYEYRVDMRQAVSNSEVPCVTDVPIDFGPTARFSYDGTGTTYDVYVITSGGIGSVGLYDVGRNGNVIDFIFNQPVCAGPPGGTGMSSYFFGLASVSPPHAVTANVGWPGLDAQPVSGRAANHP